jgi:hypothetical protein
MGVLYGEDAASWIFVLANLLEEVVARKNLLVICTGVLFSLLEENSPQEARWESSTEKML